MAKQFRNNYSLQKNLAFEKQIETLRKENQALKLTQEALYQELDYRNLLLFSLLPTTMAGEDVFLDFIKAEKDLGATEEELQTSTYTIHSGEEKKSFEYLKKHWQILVEQGPQELQKHLQKLSEKMGK